MKTYNKILTAAAALLTLAACNKEIEPVNGNLVPMTFKAVNPDQVDTKTFLTSTARVWWSSTDEINVFANGSSNKFVVESLKNSGAEATFKGLSEVSSSYLALYPYNEAATISGSTITTTLPTVQAPHGGSFDPAANIAIGKVQNDTLRFKNAGGIIGVSIANTGVKKIRLSSSSVMTGNVSIEVDENGIPAATVTGGESYVELAGNIDENRTYFFCLAPGKYKNIELTFTKADGLYATVHTDASLAVSRNGRVELGNFSFTDEEWAAGGYIEQDPSVYPSYVLNGTKEVAEFLANAGEREIVNNLSIIGSDVTSLQMREIKNRVETVKGNLYLEEVVNDDYAANGNWLETQFLLYNEADISGIKVEGGLTIKNVTAGTNPSGLRGLKRLKGDLVLDHCVIPCQDGWDPFTGLVSIGGDLILDGINAKIDNVDFPALSIIGGDFKVNSCNQNFWNFDGLSSLQRVGGDIVITNNQYLENIRGLEKLEYIGGNVIILDNPRAPETGSGDLVGYCIFKEFATKGILSPEAQCQFGTTGSIKTLDLVKNCDGTGGGDAPYNPDQPEDPTDPSQYPSYVLNGSDEVAAFINGAGEKRESVNNLTVKGGDVSPAQLTALKGRVEYVYGMFCLDGVADTTNFGSNSWLQTDQIFHSGSNDNGIHMVGGITLQNLNCIINANGFQGVATLTGDLILRDLYNLPMTNGWDPFNTLRQINGNLVVERLKSGLGNFNFSALRYVGGSLTVNDCDNGFWNISGMPQDFTVEGDLILTNNGVAFTYPDWRTGFYKFKKIGGNVVILDNAIDNGAKNYCFVRDLMISGVISSSASISIGKTSSPVDIADVKACNAGTDDVEGGNEGYDDRKEITE